ncbi:hypothetical protein [Sedimenticola selenatireducens]|uniref:hypothetical protein n=1 Tax=Sedimenticola selenatireducens TaxID=191960 RepID=UPI0012FC4590|nr:hypothetical protein [Sedimenticola selenatireducens]
MNRTNFILPCALLKNLGELVDIHVLSLSLEFSVDAVISDVLSIGSMQPQVEITLHAAPS